MADHTMTSERSHHPRLSSHVCPTLAVVSRKSLISGRSVGDLTKLVGDQTELVGDRGDPARVG